MLLKGTKAKVAGVDGWAFQSCDGAFDGLQVKVRNGGFKAFRGDAVDGAGA